MNVAEKFDTTAFVELKKSLIERDEKRAVDFDLAALEELKEAIRARESQSCTEEQGWDADDVEPWCDKPFDWDAFAKQDFGFK